MSDEKYTASSPKANLDTKEHVSTSVYMHSEEMMALVRELKDNWSLSPDQDSTGGNSYFYYSGLLVTHPQAFVEIMSLELGLEIIFDSGKEAEICRIILNALRKKRGVSEFTGALRA